MKGFLAINNFLHGEKYDILHNSLVKSAKNFGCELKIKTNQELIFESETPDFVLFWDKDTNVARMLEIKACLFSTVQNQLRFVTTRQKHILHLTEK